MGLYLYVAIWGCRASKWRKFFYNFTHLDTVCCEKFFELFASKYPADLHIIQVDNGGFHSSLNLSIPPECDFTISASL
jgi:hypothetical protein